MAIKSNPVRADNDNVVVSARIGEQTEQASSAVQEPGDYPISLATAIDRLDDLLSSLDGPIAVLACCVTEAKELAVGDRRSSGQHSRLHTLIEAEQPTGHGDPLAVLALGPLEGPAEGERLARLWHANGVETVGVAVSVEGDTGDLLLAAAISALVEARQFNIEGVIVCSDDERSWTLGDASGGDQTRIEPS